MNSTESYFEDVNFTIIYTEWSSTVRQFMVGNIFIMLVLGLLAMAGNLLTLAAFVKFEKLRTSRYMMVASLAVCDALVGSAWIFLGLTAIFRLCHLVTPAAMTATSVVSHVHILLMAVDRFIALTAPFRHAELMSSRRILLLIAATSDIWSYLCLNSPLLGVGKIRLWSIFARTSSIPNCDAVFFIHHCIHHHGCYVLLSMACCQATGSQN